MIFKSFCPGSAVQEFVLLYRICHFVFPAHFRVYPNPCPPKPEQCIVFCPRGAIINIIAGDKTIFIQPRSVLVGQATRRVDWRSLSNEILFITVVFKPGALHRLTGIPFNLLTNRVIDLESIYFRKASELNDSLNGSDSYKAMIDLIEAFLLVLIARPKLNYRPSDRVFELIAQNKYKFSLEFLSREACWSPRQFERKSLDYIGISPKLFSRIGRFNQSHLLSLQELRPDWLGVALYCGYEDYQHLVKDYKLFTCNTPQKFLQEESRSMEHTRVLNI